MNPFAGFFIVCLLLALHSVEGAEFFISPQGTLEGDGSRNRPWDLKTALHHPPTVHAGDVLWLKGGIYQGGFVSLLQGEKDRPIIVRQAPGERATIDCWSTTSSSLFDVRGDWVTFWGFEVTCSDLTRVSSVPAWGDLNRGGFHSRASHIAFINLVVHDTLGGFGFWSEGEAGNIYGCLIYNNGWSGPDRGHGHGIYALNKRSVKVLAENIVFNQFGCGLHVYGSKDGPVEGFDIKGNIAFNNGSLNGPDDRVWNILVGGSSPASRINLAENFAYHSVKASSVQLGYGAANETFTCKDNYFQGLTRFVRWKSLTVTGNTFIGQNPLIGLEVPPTDKLNVDRWDRNSYISLDKKYRPFELCRNDQLKAMEWQDWQKVGRDPSGQFAENPKRVSRVFVRPNHYESGRGHIVVFNGSLADTVAVDLSSILSVGTDFRIVSAQDFFGPTVLSGRYTGETVQLSMEPVPAVKPVGMNDFELPVTEPGFGVYVVLATTPRQ